MRILIIILTLLIISGCSTISKLIDTAGNANDKALVSAETVVCRAASIGSILRRYDTEEKARAWKQLCTQSNDSVPIIIDGN